MIFFDIDQRSPDWHQIKLGVLSASDAYKIVCGGKGLETLCQQKVAEILTGESSIILSMMISKEELIWNTRRGWLTN